jgi:hypothetical protein
VQNCSRRLRWRRLIWQFGGLPDGRLNWWFGAKAVQTPMTPRRFPPPWRASPRVPSSPRRTGRGGTICQTECSTLSTAFQESFKMIRVPTVFLMLAGGIAVLFLPYANAQSPNPALIAPGSSGAGLAPPTPSAPSPQPRSSAPDPAPGGNTVQAPSGTTPTPSIMTQGAPSTSGSSSGSPSKK